MRDAAHSASVEAAFELLATPSLVEVPPFRLAYARIRGPYVPWARVQALDMVAETLERHGVDRAGPAFGLYHDLPFSERDVEGWTADLGYPVDAGASVPPLPQVRVLNVPAFEAVALRYRGDLTSFPEALQFLVDWAGRKEIDLGGPLLQRFHVSDALDNVEEREVFVALRPLPA